MRVTDCEKPARNGWAPGDYICTCRDCGERFDGAKRSYQCQPCAYKAPVIALAASRLSPKTLSEDDVVYITYLLSNRAKLRDKILGASAVGVDASALCRILKVVEKKLRERGIRVDSFTDKGAYK